MYQYRSPMEFKTGVGSNLPNRKGFCEGQVVNLRIRIRLVSQKPIFANASCLIGDPDIKIGGALVMRSITSSFCSMNRRRWSGFYKRTSIELEGRPHDQLEHAFPVTSARSFQREIFVYPFWYSKYSKLFLNCDCNGHRCFISYQLAIFLVAGRKLHPPK